jgi:hypothetical protein
MTAWAEDRKLNFLSSWMSLKAERARYPWGTPHTVTDKGGEGGERSERLTTRREKFLFHPRRRPMCYL